MRIQSLTFFFICACINISIAQQTNSIQSPSVKTGVFHGISEPLKNYASIKDRASHDKNRAEAKKKYKENKVELNSELKTRFYPNAKNALPKGPDPVLQNALKRVQETPIIDANFSGQSASYGPTDCNGAIGPNHFMQSINSSYTIYNKTGTLLVGPNDMNTLFSGVTGANCNDGDPIIIYDEAADRWLAAEFSLCSGNDRMLIAVSTSNDPTGTWYKYSFDVDDTPDYPKFGVWNDGYYMGVNNSIGKDVYVFERSVMVTGGSSPKMIGFDNSERPNSGFHTILPLDNDGTLAPPGTPGLFITINDDAWGGTSDALWIFELKTDWITPSNSTFIRVQELPVPSFDSNFGTTWENIAQKGTTQKVDAIPQILMFRAQYIDFGNYQTILCCHTVDVDNSDHAGIRWYELRNNDSSWTIRQNGTYAPDGHSRWMGSISMNKNHEIGLGYSISSTTLYPGIRFTGQSAAENANASGNLDIAETVLHSGTASQTFDLRWGDYSEMSVDPVNNNTFWFTTEYNKTNTQKGTKISAFRFPPSITCDSTKIITTCSGVFEDGSGNLDYTNNLDCFWLLQPPGANTVTLSFTSFNTELGHDYVNVYDGTSTSSTLLATFSGDSLPSTITSTGGNMLVQFISDSMTKGNGWAVNFSSTNCLGLTISTTNVSCFGGNDGSATVVASGGTSPYSYLWSTVPIQTGSVATALSAGTYFITVTDNNNITVLDSIIIIQKIKINITSVITSNPCGTGNDGAIDISVTGGTPGYTYLWSDSTLTEDKSLLLPGTYTVTVTDSKNCTSTLSNTLSLDAVSVLPFYQDFESTIFKPIGWSIINPDGELSWDRKISITGYSGISTAACYIKHYDYIVNVGTRDELITNPIDLSGSIKPMLNFNLAYARYSGTSAEKLRILLSTDCGVNFPNVIYNKSGLDADGNTLTTVSNINTEFFPTNIAHWRKETIDLDSYNSDKIVLKFESTNGYGNNLFIDNVFISDSLSVAIPDFNSLSTKSDSKVKIYPNPAGSHIFVEMENPGSGKIEIIITTIIGKEIVRKSYTSDSHKIFLQNIDISSFSDPLYIVRIKTKEKVYFEKVGKIR